MDYLTLSLLSMVLIGFNTFAIKLVAHHLHPALLLVTKFGIGVVGLFIYLSYTKIPLVWNKYVLYGCLVGIWWSGIMVLYYTAIARGPLSVVIPIFNLNLVIPAVLGFIFLNEPVTMSKIFGLIFACLAVILLTR
ncbi:MAG TPA: EamA family transporter [Thermodesulfobacteriota bacterium]|nr:EamA family transporter [Thermodesulfobacteriota bacterium]